MAAKPLIAKIQPSVGKLNKILNEDNFFIGNEFQYENGIIRVKGTKCTKRVPFQFTHSNCKGLLILIEVNEEEITIPLSSLSHINLYYVKFQGNIFINISIL
ncbi:hypothetical protein BLOT_016766 [Blomia tropicalis]|nr:hypothetical protein BLOT_016766 [Blomia tropicalis]